VKIGVQLQPQHTSVGSLRSAWRAADELGVDSIWIWDHFYPLYGDPEGAHFECWTLLAALAADTSRARFGALVSGIGYRNPDLLADMARTIDHVAGGRLVLGLGAGWFERDYDEYGFEFGTAGSRLRALESALERIRTRFSMLTPGPVGDLPILIGGGGEKVTLRLVAEHASMWNGFGTPSEWGRKNGILDEWCARVGREPGAIERSVLVDSVPHEGVVDAYREAGVDLLIIGLSDPFDLDGVAPLL
jgi:probable F420-dependent oxidoreductase